MYQYFCPEDHDITIYPEKEDDLKDLPEKLEKVRYAPLSGKQQKIYDAQVLRIRDEIIKDERIRVFAERTKIRESCCGLPLILEDYQASPRSRLSA